MSSPLDRPHVWIPGTGRPLLLLHGTGGDEHDLLPLRDHLAPGAPTLSVRGSVMENGMPRFFRRVSEGVFDEDDIRLRAGELADFLTAAEREYAETPGQLADDWTAVGFSNGANIASALVMTHPDAVARAVLFAAMVPFADGPPPLDLTGRQALIVNGARDPMATDWHTNTLAEQLRSRGARVDVLGHAGGHTVDGATLPQVRQWLESSAVPA